MMSGKAQAGQAPTAFGSMLQASTYGMTIPVLYGRVLTPLLAIWANNLREGGSGKKGKGGGKKGGPKTYVEAIDFLIGKNPIMTSLQFWNNNAKIPLADVTYSAAQAASITIPDSHFYAVIAVTLTQSYSVTFNDYGADGSDTLSGTFEVPLWNAVQAGPDPTNNGAYRNFPYTYRWKPSDGATIHLDNYGVMPAGTIKIYYVQLMAATSYLSPAAKLRMSFENILGSGSEYAGYTSEQIEYPWYAGVGSPDIDLGSGGTIPAIKCEALGKWGIYPTGDGDFVDIIEDIFKSGITQSAIGGTLGFGPTQHGVACYDFPGPVQKKLSKLAGTVTFDMPVTAGAILVVVVSTPTAGTIAASDSLNGAWTAAATGTRGANNYGVFYFVGSAAGSCSVSFTHLGATASIEMMEMAGVDTFDSVSITVGTNPGGTAATSNPGGQVGLVLAISVTSGTNVAAQTALWPEIMTDGGTSNGELFIQQRKVTNPGNYALKWASAQAADSVMVMLSFKAVQPAAYPNPLPDILDPYWIEQTRAQCRAGGLWGALAMTSQQAASDWIKDLVEAANCAPVWSGFRMKLIPRSEVSAAGNGAIYIAPTASGPVFNLDARKGDFLEPPKLVRKARTDLDTVVQMQHINRTSDYQQIVTVEPDAASIAKYGVRKADPVVNNAVQDVSVARSILQMKVRRQNYVENLVWQFKLNARFQVYESMDLGTITDELQGVVGVPVRLTSVEEDDQYNLTCEAEPFIYGINAPQSLPVTTPAPYRPDSNVSAGNVNAPVIFEPVPQIYGAQNQQQLWLVVSSPSVVYGGCQVMISTDGGSSYNSAGDPIVGNAVTGVTVGSWPAAASPDTTNDLPVDLTESLGVLSSYQVSDEDNFVYPCYVAGTSTPIPYELMTYAVATLTAANKFTLKATGGNHLDRGVFGAPAAGAGALHAGGSRFALLPPDGVGILKLTMDPLWIGKTLYFKFLSFNNFGTAVQSLADVSPYTYTPTGGSGSVNPSGAPPQLFLVNGA